MKNKKEPLSIIVVKTLLAVIIFTGLGTIIIGGAYLIGKQGNNKFSKQSPTLCKNNFDCPLQMKCENFICVDVGCIKEGGSSAPPISPRYTNHMATKCCEGLKAIIFSGGYDENCNYKPLYVGASTKICSDCGNGICESWENRCNCPEDCVEKEVSITTDKMEYFTDDDINIKMTNNTKSDIFFVGPVDCPASLKFFGYNANNIWEDITPQWKCLTTKEKMISSESIDLDFDFKYFSNLSYNKYRLEFVYSLKEFESAYSIPHELIAEATVTYSNEFTIKEKSALDPRCGEKVKDLSGVGDIDCTVISFGYEYDSVAKKCVMRAVDGCSFKSPFKTLEECQEVCEKKENVIVPDKDELIKCENDSDCVLIDPEQCDCSSCLTKAINKKYFDAWRAYVGEECYLEMVCPMEASICESYEVKCDNNKCVAVKK